MKFDSALSYGTAFNVNGGGFYVMSRSRDSGVQIWFWPRNSPYIPLEIFQGGLFEGEPLFPSYSWGEPAAAFPMDPGYCNYDQRFNAHIIIFDLTFCVRVPFPFTVFVLFASATEVLSSTYNVRLPTHLLSFTSCRQ